MPKKTLNIPEKTPQIVSESAVAYQTRPSKISSSNQWNPNVPFHGTQEEWWEHFHRIEEGEFMTPNEYRKRFNSWKKDFLASRMK